MLVSKHSTLHANFFLREGRSHSWWYNIILNKRSAIPRHNEIRDILVIKICKDLGIPRIK
ncbi:MAG TPA: addiction module toxin, HicA family [Candidatus Atribacteria bacterium]|nr:addiction module toxin, HicA family [Candidatus Atribacteria bacterium]